MKKILLKSVALMLATVIAAVLLFPVCSKADDQRPDYVVYVNRVMNTVTVMQVATDGTEIPVRVFACSCGRSGHLTPLGTYYTSDYYDWRLMVDGTYGRYAVRFNRKIMFHSVPYLSATENSLEWQEYNKLGSNASLGCVRLAVGDAKWIYDNCKPGTKVVIYCDGSTPGPLGKPVVPQIPADSPFRGWDPTDQSPANPWWGGNGVI